MNEEQIRAVAADNMAQGFILEILLSQYFRSFPEDVWDVLAETIKTTGRKTEHFAGLAPNDHEAEAFADVVVRMHAALDGIVERSKLRATAGLRTAEAQALRSEQSQKKD